MSDDDDKAPDSGLNDPTQPIQPDAGPVPPVEAEAWVSPQVDTAAESIPAHPVPATPLGEGSRCPRCGTDNRPGIAFCRSCGQRLAEAGSAAAAERPAAPQGTEACPRCGTHNRAGVAFCQHCGANLRPPDPGVPVVPRRSRSVGRAVLGPAVLLIGAIGMATAWLLPFAFGGASLWDRSFGAPGGYGIGFWQGYPAGSFLDQVYFGLAAPVPILVLLLVVLAIGGIVRGVPGPFQRIGIAIALAWGLALAVLFAVVELLGGTGGDLLALLRSLSPAGIIFLLAGLIVAIGSLTRLWRS